MFSARTTRRSSKASVRISLYSVSAHEPLPQFINQLFSPKDDLSICTRHKKPSRHSQEGDEPIGGQRKSRAGRPSTKSRPQLHVVGRLSENTKKKQDGPWVYVNFINYTFTIDRERGRHNGRSGFVFWDPIFPPFLSCPFQQLVRSLSFKWNTQPGVPKSTTHRQLSTARFRTITQTVLFLQRERTNQRPLCPPLDRSPVLMDSLALAETTVTSTPLGNLWPAACCREHARLRVRVKSPSQRNEKRPALFDGGPKSAITTQC